MNAPGWSARAPAGLGSAQRVPALIIGGGPAGCAAAITLGAAGRPALLIEKTPGERDLVCGGFLGWDALAALRRLGIDPEELGARPIEHLRLVVGGQAVEARLPYRAAGLSRRRLDLALIERAGAVGTIVRRGLTARSADEGAVRLGDGTVICADSLFLATGKHELRGLARNPGKGGRAPSVGLRTRLAPDEARTRALAGTIELHLFEQAYAGLLLQEDGSANLCLSASTERLARAGGPEALVGQLAQSSPLFADRLVGAQPEWQAIARVPYGWRARPGETGLFRLGDQAAVIASLVGDGIAVALASGTMAARACLIGGAGAAPDYQRHFSARAALPLFVAERLRRAAETRMGGRLLQLLAGTLPAAARAAARLTRI